MSNRELSTLWYPDQLDPMPALEMRNRRRNARVRAARARGTHSEQQWQLLVLACGSKCVRCGCTDRLYKDHIVAVCQDGSDSIDNLQPLCKSCNCWKGGVGCIDYRPIGWREAVGA